MLVAYEYCLTWYLETDGTEAALLGPVADLVGAVEAEGVVTARYESGGDIVSTLHTAPGTSCRRGVTSTSDGRRAALAAGWRGGVECGIDSLEGSSERVAVGTSCARVRPILTRGQYTRGGADGVGSLEAKR